MADAVDRSQVVRARQIDEEAHDVVDQKDLRPATAVTVTVTVTEASVGQHGLHGAEGVGDDSPSPADSTVTAVELNVAPAETKPYTAG